MGTGPPTLCAFRLGEPGFRRLHRCPMSLERCGVGPSSSMPTESVLPNDLSAATASLAFVFRRARRFTVASGSGSQQRRVGTPWIDPISLAGRTSLSAARGRRASFNSLRAAFRHRPSTHLGHPLRHELFGSPSRACSSPSRRAPTPLRTSTTTSEVREDDSLSIHTLYQVFNRAPCEPRNFRARGSRHPARRAPKIPCVDRTSYGSQWSPRRRGVVAGALAPSVRADLES